MVECFTGVIENMFNEGNVKKTISVYLTIFFVLMIMYCSAHNPSPIGEWDDYSLEVATLLNDHNFGISAEDIAYHKKLFPEWSEYINGYSLTGFFTKSGSGELTWYFPTYGAVCIPMVLILKCLHLPAVYTFHCTNIILLLFSVTYLAKYIEVDSKKKLFLILLLTVNPIVFYLSWPSAETLIFSLIVISMVAWYNKWYKRAAIFVSIAGTLNPTILFIGIVMIIDYCANLVNKKSDDTSWIPFIQSSLSDLLKYGCCYVIGLIPMAYNYYNFGVINATAALFDRTAVKESTLSRFVAYLFDLNFGIFPYFSILLIIGAILTAGAIKKVKARYLLFIFAFLGTMLAYSNMFHINCGVSGISRYNAWNAVILIFAVGLYYDTILPKDTIKRICRGMICSGIVLMGIILLVYNPYRAAATSYTYMTPIAKTVLRYAPELYNPLFSTFNSRVNHLDGAYNYWEYMPIIYEDDDGYVRKILADSTNKKELRKTLLAENGKNDSLEREINSLGRDAEYINVPRREKIVKANEYKIGTILDFKFSDNNVDEYTIRGFGGHEEWGTWTDGHVAVMRFSITSSCEEILGIINGIVFNDEQKIGIYINNKEVFSNDGFTGGTIEFTFDNPGENSPIELRIELPNAISPADLGSSDTRVLGLGIQNMLFLEKTQM